MPASEGQPLVIQCHKQDVAKQFLLEPQTLAVDLGCLDTWRQGRDRYYCWVIEVDCESILARVRRWQDRLAPWLVSYYVRQPHMTLAIGGFWRDGQIQRVHNDDFLASDLEHQIDRLGRLRSADLQLQVLGSNSFPSAPFLEVGVGNVDGLRRLRQCLTLASDDFRSAPYCPHITLGLYKRAYPTSELDFLMTNAADREPLPLSVTHVSLMSYDSRERGGCLRLERRIALA